MTRPEAPEPLPRPVVDNHCHLDMARGTARVEPTAPTLRQPDQAVSLTSAGGAGHDTADGQEGPLTVAQALELSTAVGVPRIVQIGCDLPGARWAVDVAREWPQIVAGVALHPNEAPRVDLDDQFTQIEALAREPVVRAIGETGLDYFRTDESGRDSQQASFRRHIELAKLLDKTLVIHDREAHTDVVRLVDEQGSPDRVVMHCFSGDAAFARECLDRGFYLSFAGTITFKNAAGLREALSVAPSDRILVETDAPYLTPMPWRGRVNASYLIPLTVRAMAEVRADDLEALCEALEANTFAAFGGPW